LHWAGDTRAVAGHAVDWSNRVDVDVERLKAYRRGDPWLSAGLLKMGDSIYLPKWETDQATPILLHVQSIADLELFGVFTGNYGALVMDQGSWETRYEMSAGSLRRGELAAAASAAPVAPGIASGSGSGAGQSGATGAGSPSAASAAARLNRTPSLGSGGDVTFAPPSSWSDVFSVDRRDAHLELMYSENLLGTWTLADGVYAAAFATSLDYNPAIKQVQDLARQKFIVYCKDAESCTGSEQPTAITVGGAPAVRYDTRSRVHVTARSSSDGSDAVSQREWISRQVFVIYGNWGYEFRLFTEDPPKFAVWTADFDKVIDNVRFTY
jgi:hypothetical protein